ncbi:MAG: MtsA protein [Myxococcota bacterium]
MRRVLIVLAVAIPVLILLFARPRPVSEGTDADEPSAVESSTGLPKLVHISPRHISNETPYPLRIVGEGLRPGLELQLARKEERFSFELRPIDDRLSIAVVEGLSIPPQLSLAEFRASLVSSDGDPSSGTAPLWVVNDAEYGTATSLAVHPQGSSVFVASRHTDQIHVHDGSGWRSLKTADGPIDLATWIPPGKAPWLVVAHRWAPELRLLRMDDSSGPHRTVTVPAGTSRVAVSGNFAYLSNRRTDAVHVVDLLKGEVVASGRVGLDPGPLDAEDGVLVVGNEGSTDLAHLRLEDEKDFEVTSDQRVAADAGTSIIGGHTEPYQKFVMASSAPRDIVLSPEQGVAFIADVGPVVGPNPDRMEVSMNGGVGVYELEARRVIRHVSLKRGVPRALALDREAGVLYAADIAAGRVVALDARRLVKSDASAREAILVATQVEPPAGTRFVRPVEDFSVQGRNGTSIHSGPVDLVLAAGSLFVLQRFTGVVHEAKLEGVRSGHLNLKPLGTVPGLATQARRRFGEVLYYTDLGNTRMSCDACHYEGHSSGVLFTKGEPMHIYRTPTILSSRESPPYFTPALIPSLHATAEFVLARNRFHNPDPTRVEIAALGSFQETYVQPPNPELATASRALLTGGRALFEGKGDCARCHPSPQFTTDQDPKTRRRLYDVGTRVTLPLRPELQDDDFYPLPAPSLVGLWNNYPLLHSAAGGFSVTADERVLATHDDAIDAVFEMGLASEKHGRLHQLDDAERALLKSWLLLL